MIITSTAISFILLSLGLALCGWRFLVVYRKTYVGPDSSKIALLIAWQFIAFVVQNGVMGIGLLIFANDAVALSQVMLISGALITVPALLGVYIAYHIFSPKNSPYPLMAVVCLIAGIMIATGITTPPTPYLTAQNNIDLRASFPLSVATFYLLLISIGSNGYIFTKLFFSASEKRMRRLCAILALISWVGVINVFIRLVLLYHSPPDERSSLLDTGLLLQGLVFVIVLLIAPGIQNWLRTRRS
jgi:hypothetical protein